MSLRSAVAWIVVAPFVAFAVVRLAGLDRGWPLVQLVAFVPWAAAGAAAAALPALVLGARAAALAALASCLALGAVVAPRAIQDGGARAPEAVALRVLTANLLGDRASSEAVVALVRRTRADVLSLQELSPEALGELERAGLRRELPHAVLRERPGFRGSGLYARRPLRAGAEPATSAETTVATLRTPDGPAVEVLAVHPQAPIGRQRVPAWRADLRALPPAPGGDPVRILAGDFNATVDHREFRRVLDRGYADAAARAGKGLTATWPAGRRVPPGVTIDHVLAPERVAVGEVSVHTVAGSDHRAVFAELFLPRR